MKVKDILAQLSDFSPESDIFVYDDDNDRVLDIACVAEDDADESNPPRVFVFV